MMNRQLSPALFNLYYTSAPKWAGKLIPMQYGEQQCCSGYGFGPAIRNYYVVHYVYSGSGFLMLNGKRYDIKKRMYFVIYPGQVTYYEADGTDPWLYRWVEFGGSAADEVVSAAGFSEACPVLYDEVFSVGTALENMVKAGDAGFETIMGYLWMFIASLTKNRAENAAAGSAERYVDAAERYIRSNLHRHITIEELAEFLNIDRSYLSRLFRKYKGSSTQRYIIDLRLGTAAQLLRSGKNSVKEIAQSVGYPNQLDFSKAFKAKFGCPPSVWRNMGFWDQSVRSYEND